MADPVEMLLLRNQLAVGEVWDFDGVWYVEVSWPGPRGSHAGNYAIGKGPTIASALRSAVDLALVRKAE